MPQQYDTDNIVANFAVQLPTVIVQHGPNRLHADMPLLRDNTCFAPI